MFPPIRRPKTSQDVRRSPTVTPRLPALSPRLPLPPRSSAFEELSSRHYALSEPERVGNPRGDNELAKREREELRKVTKANRGRKPIRNIRMYPTGPIPHGSEISTVSGGPIHFLTTDRRNDERSVRDYNRRLQRIMDEAQFKRDEGRPKAEIDAFIQDAIYGKVRGFTGLGRPIWDQHKENMMTYNKCQIEECLIA